MVLGNILKYILDTDQQGGADLDTDKAFDKVNVTELSVLTGGGGGGGTFAPP